MMNKWLIKQIKPLWDISVNLVYPNYCLICDNYIGWTESRPVCNQCWQRAIIHTPPFCSKCGRPLDDIKDNVKIKKHKNLRCSSCLLSRFYFQEGWTVSTFEGIIKECIHLLKYQGKISLAKPLGDLMARFYLKYLKNHNFELIIPVPLSKTRYREREFNQAELLARHVCRITGSKMATDILVRDKHTPAQVNLDRLHRLSNLRGAFKVKSKIALTGKNILLIDDVFTTGSTLNECARTLLEAGAGGVCIFALARGKLY